MHAPQRGCELLGTEGAKGAHVFVHVMMSSNNSGLSPLQKQAGGSFAVFLEQCWGGGHKAILGVGQPLLCFLGGCTCVSLVGTVLLPFPVSLLGPIPVLGLI